MDNGCHCQDQAYKSGSRGSGACVKPASPFSANNAAVALHDAMTGFGTDEKVIVDVLSSHTNSQRQDVALIYAAKYNKELVQDLNTRLSGDFRLLVLSLLDKPAKHDAKQLRRALEGFGTDESTLIEILCSRTSEEIQLIKEEYRNLYKKELHDDITDDTSGTFQNLLVALLTVKRDNSWILVPEIVARSDAAALYQYTDGLLQAGDGRLGTNEATFTRILCERTYSQLLLTFEFYKKKYQKDIEEAIKSETSGVLRDAFLTLVNVVRNKPAYFAERLYYSMKGLGTNDTVLIRNMVARSEIDMMQIKAEFVRQYGESLESYIIGDTGGSYKDLLLALCREPES